MAQKFDAIADAYDRWYDTPEGQAVFQAEVACLRAIRKKVRGRWLEVGVGTGRFALALGVKEGIDPSPRMLEKAAGRGIRTYLGAAEHLPFPDGAFNGVLMSLSLCFMSDAEQAMRECARVVSASGSLLIGMIPADSPWGQLYKRKGVEGHTVYSAATFYTCDEVVRLATDEGLVFDAAFSCLFSHPGSPVIETSPREGIVESAGFVAVAFAQCYRLLV